MVPWWGFFLKSLVFLHWISQSVGITVQSAHNMGMSLSPLFSPKTLTLCIPLQTWLQTVYSKHIFSFPTSFICLWFWNDFNSLCVKGSWSWGGQPRGCITTRIDGVDVWKFLEKDTVLSWNIYCWNGRIFLRDKSETSTYMVADDSPFFCAQLGHKLCLLLGLFMQVALLFSRRHTRVIRHLVWRCKKQMWGRK